MNIGMWIIIIIGGAAGLLSILYIVAALLGVLVYKVIRRVGRGISMFN